MKLFTIHSWKSVRLSAPRLADAPSYYGDRLGLLVSFYSSSDSKERGQIGFELRRPDVDLVVDVSDEVGTVQLLIDDLDNCLAHFVTAGAAIQDPPHDTPAGRYATMRDPLGNTVVLTELILEREAERTGAGT